MGAGCYYTNNHTKQVAPWIDIEQDDDKPNPFAYDDMVQDVSVIMDSLGYISGDNSRLPEFYNGLFKVTFESTYYGDGLVIQVAPRYEDKSYHIAMANIDRAENRIARALVKNGMKLRIATSGYTATNYNP